MHVYQMASDCRQTNLQGVSTCSDATRQTPSDSDKTPTICLFQRFESLTISTPAAATAGKSVTASAGGPANDNDKSRPRHSVAFGTPSVLTYTPAAVPAAAQASPLWSNAGQLLLLALCCLPSANCLLHSSTSAASPGIMPCSISLPKHDLLQGVDCDQLQDTVCVSCTVPLCQHHWKGVAVLARPDNQSACCTKSILHILQHEHRCLVACVYAGHTPYSLSDASATGRVTECDDGNSHSSSGVCMELFSSVITDTGAEQTPAGSNIPRTPLLGLAATATPAVSDTPAAALTATAAGVTPRSTGLPSSPDAAEADDMDLQTPVIRHLQTTQQPNAANGCSFTGFNTVQDCLDTGHPKDGTPVFFSKGKAQLAAEDGTSTSVNTAQGATPAGAISSLSMPTLTPKSRLKQPARVQLHTSR